NGVAGAWLPARAVGGGATGVARHHRRRRQRDRRRSRGHRSSHRRLGVDRSPHRARGGGAARLVGVARRLRVADGRQADAALRQTAMHALFRFVFYYPFFMALFWIAGALIFFFRREWRRQGRPVLASHPAVTVLIPCRNEALSIEQVVRTAAASRYPGLEILVIDDAST